MASIIPHNPRAAGTDVFNAVLTPHRSLGRLGFYMLMGFVGSLCLGAGLLFYSIGAWPVACFLGLDVALVWLAFRINYRDGRITEYLRLSHDHMTVRRVLPSGRVREWRFQPYWLRVEMDDPPRHDSRLTLTSHGRRLTVGDFLTVEERHDIARALGAALSRLRCLSPSAS